MRLPLWFRLLRDYDRAFQLAARTHDIVRDEVIFAWLAPASYDQVTRDAYARAEDYLPGGSIFARGLFEWEREILDGPHFPKRGRVLLAAAGGGRELLALCQRGFEVLAFEPSPLVEGARQVARGFPHATVVQASYSDLIAACEARVGPLASFCAPGTFDAVLLGWGSLIHVTEPQLQLEILRAARALAPRGPTLASFALAPPPGSARGRSDRLRSALRSAFRPLGAHPPPPSGVTYSPSGGVLYTFHRDELLQLAARSGFSVERLEAYPFPHALLLPTPPSG